jgi:hypothetical protein
MAFEAQVTQLSSSDLDRLFDATPEGTPNADTLAVGKQDNTPAVTAVQAGDDIPVFDDSLLAPDADDADDSNKDDDKTKDTSKKDDSKKDDSATDDSDKDDNKDDDKVDTEQVSSVLKNTVDYLVDQGLWVDFEGREGLEITQEVYAELAAKQAQHTAYEIVNELVDSTGSYGKAIISHIKQGGNPDEIIDLFKEQKAIEQIDTSTEDGKQLKIEKYYKDVLGWKSEKVTKTVNRLIEDNEIDSEFDDVEELYNKHYEKKLAEIEEQTKAAEIETKRKQEAFVGSIQDALDEETSLTTRDKQVIASSILDFKHKLDNGQKVNDFYLKFAEMQSDPKKYIKLVRFVMDTEGYEKQVQVQEKTKASKEIFNFIKGNAAITKSKSQDIDINENPRNNKKQGTDFSFLIKK